MGSCTSTAEGVEPRLQVEFAAPPSAQTAQLDLHTKVDVAMTRAAEAAEGTSAVVVVVITPVAVAVQVLLTC
jgi:hypothetical protein